jgi:hypothetical protein
MIKSFYSFIVLGAGAFAMNFMASSCSPLDKEYHRHTAEDDYRRIVEMEKLDTNDTKLMAKYMVERGLIAPHVLEYHATYRHILEEAKKEEERHRIEQTKAKHERDFAQMHTKDKLQNLSKALKVTILENEIPLPEPDPKAKGKAKKEKAEPTDKNILNYRIGFINVGEKEIKAFKGEIAFIDLFQTKVKGITFSNFQNVAPGDTLIQNVKVNLNEINNSTSLSPGITREDLKPEWHPERLIYIDGQIIE